LNKPSETASEELQRQKEQIDEPQSSDVSLSSQHYRQLQRWLILSTAVIALLPLLAVTAANYHQYRQALMTESRRPITRLTANGKRAVETFLQERESALRMTVNGSYLKEDCSDALLDNALRDLRRSISIGAFVDLGVIDDAGRQKCYVGPFGLTGRDYSRQDWFRQVRHQGIFISDVFLGYRKLPHFVIAIHHESADDPPYTLRGTIDTARLHEQLLLVGLGPTSDIFLVNHEGVLQSPSHRYGQVLDKIPLPIPENSDQPQILELTDESGDTITVAAAHVDASPFVLMIVTPSSDVFESWFKIRNRLFGLLAILSVLVFSVILVLARKLIRSIRDSDRARAQVFHKIEYTNKLASVGRLAAGVAHEINNPLAIINETAGLFKDRLPGLGEFPDKEKVLVDIDSILNAVDRCSTITHRLLGFARHMDVGHEPIGLVQLIKEVLGFMEKEAAYRGINVHWKVDDDMPTISSDRGQLQQVFLNIINNAFAALDDGGQMEISIQHLGDDRVEVTIEDLGVGIPKVSLGRIFEPFFTTRPGVGTGLGLSVTHGLVKRLGGLIMVDSEQGRGTSFTVILPLASDQ
jgi:two-component system NtrC family sensor kinase